MPSSRHHEQGSQSGPVRPRISRTFTFNSSCGVSLCKLHVEAPMRKENGVASFLLGSCHAAGETVPVPDAGSHAFAEG
jgi:hypothetical protein